MPGASTLPEGARAAAGEFLRRYSAYRYGLPASSAALVTTLKDLLSKVR